MADEIPNDLKVEPDDAGALFRAEMWVTDSLMRYWRQILAVIVVGLVAILLYGQYSSWQQTSQRRTTARIADLQNELPRDLFSLAQVKAGLTPDEDLDMAALKEVAGKMVATGDAASGTSAIEAYLKAAELYRLADDTAGRKAALEKANANATGVLSYAAKAGLASIELESEAPDDALQRYRRLKVKGGYLAQQATRDLAAALETLGRPAEARAEYEAYLSNWPDAPDSSEISGRLDKLAGGQGE